ncbi:hypothetical protein GCM10009001_18070 [Virgibacillus siamensis]|uniref:Uncharacterized protein n=1 Tax=Virgibacillus siamensis TaxID=480071 RepID=A0ABN1G0L5_9BACI
MYEMFTLPVRWSYSRQSFHQVKLLKYNQGDEVFAAMKMTARNQGIELET